MTTNRRARRGAAKTTPPATATVTAAPAPPAMALIAVADAQALLNYLSQRPFAEVFELIPPLMKLTPTKD